MARTTLTAQKLQTLAGQAVTFQAIDAVNMMQVKNTGVQVVLVKTAVGDAVTVSFPSQADPFNRQGTILTAQAVSREDAYGPFTTPNIWGDAATQLYVDFSGVTGTPQIAVVTI